MLGKTVKLLGAAALALSIVGILGAATLALSIVGMTAPAHAQGKFPNKPITIVMPWKTGGLPDAIFRVLAERVSGDLGQPVVIQNITGGSGSKATLHVSKAKPDGYTLLDNWVAPHIVVPIINPDVGYNMVDWDPIAGFIFNPFTLTVAANHPSKTLDEFFKWAHVEQKKRPLNVGVCSALSVPRFVMEGYLRKHGVTNYNAVPYTGCGFDNIKGVLDGTLDFTTGQIQAKKTYGDAIRMLALLGPDRAPTAPDLPTAKELGYPLGWGSAAYGWGGLVAPKGVPADRLKLLRDVFAKHIQDPAFIERGMKIGGVIRYMAPEDFRQLWRTSEDALRPVVTELTAKKAK